MKKHTLLRAGIAAHNPHQYNVVIGTDMGQFSGTVICREEDYKYESAYFGFELAEIKAEIQWARAKRNHWDARLKALTNFAKTMCSMNSYGDDSYHWADILLKQIEEAESECEDWRNRIDAMKRLYHHKIEAFDATAQARARIDARDGRA